MKQSSKLRLLSSKTQYSSQCASRDRPYKSIFCASESKAEIPMRIHKVRSLPSIGPALPAKKCAREDTIQYLSRVVTYIISYFFAFALFLGGLSSGSSSSSSRSLLQFPLLAPSSCFP